MNPSDPAELVQRGYDHLSQRYRGDHDTPAGYAPWLSDLRQRLPDQARVLDLGCGCGIPVAKTLADQGHQVTGLDLSEVQINRARRLVPRATFLQADANQVTFPDATFDAVVCLYALIHMPLDAQPGLLHRIAGWLRPGGLFLATTGAQEWTGTQEHWLGGTATMWWCHADAATYRAWITGAGLHIDSEQFVPEADSGHQLFWAPTGKYGSSVDVDAVRLRGRATARSSCCRRRGALAVRARPPRTGAGSTTADRTTWVDAAFDALGWPNGDVRPGQT